MRLYALTFALFVLGAHAASIPDKKDIEKKLAEVVKEVLSKDEVPIDNPSSEQELINQTNDVKDVENNLKKSSQIADIPVKVVVEDVKPALKTEDKKEDNEVVPPKEESAEIVREEIDINNPGLPQHSQHDTQSPETFVDPQQAVVLKNSQWKASPQFQKVQEELKAIKDEMNKLYGSIQEHYSSAHPAENFKVRASVKQESSSNSSNPWQSWYSGFMSQMDRLNQTISGWNNSSQCSGSGTQSDEQRPPGFFANIQQGFTNFLQGGGQPAGAQSDSQQPAQPSRPVIDAITNAFQSVSNAFRPPGSAQSETPQKPAQATTQDGSNAVPQTVEVPVEGEAQKDKPEQVTLAPQQSGPIKQMIGNSAVVQGIAGAVQRIQHTIMPNRPREDVKSAVKDSEDTKAGWIPPPPSHPKPSGDNNDSSSSGVESKSQAEAAEKEVLLEKEAEPTVEEKTPEAPEKTEPVVA